MRTRNSERSSSGAWALRSTCKSKPRKIAEARKAARAIKPTPDLATCCNPRISDTTVSSKVTMPRGSMEYSLLSLTVSGSTFHAIKAATRATGKLIKKIQRQPTESMRNPPREGPVIYPK